MSMLNLLASAARTTSSTAVLGLDFSRVRAAIFLLDVTVDESTAADKLNVFVQSSIDDGATYDDFIHFTEHAGNAGAKKYLATWYRDVTPESEMRQPADAALAAGVLQGPVGDKLRLKWVVTDDSLAASFTFSVSVRPIVN